MWMQNTGKTQPCNCKICNKISVQCLIEWEYEQLLSDDLCAVISGMMMIGIHIIVQDKYITCVYIICIEIKTFNTVSLTQLSSH